MRDIFIFSCFTGLAYADAKRLKRSDISIGMDGEKWIFTKRKKTDSPTRIPLLPTVLDIMKKYKDHRHQPKFSIPITKRKSLNDYLNLVLTATAAAFNTI